VLQPDHPASRGHFAGNPIIPGAVLLSETVMAIAAGLDAARAPLLISSAKFPHPARPGDRVMIEFSRGERSEIRFSCSVEGKPVLTGQMSCPALPTAR
jgi:3-hydroxymyristoyl/3-hydroxydecanoyl-(acyl carrier protein) dehydratase